MNKIFKVVWSKVRNCYVVVSEIAKNTVSGVGKRNRIGKVSLAATLAASVLIGGFVMPNEVWAAESAMVDAQKSHYIAIGNASINSNPFTGIQGVTASDPVWNNGKRQITVTYNTGDGDPTNDESFVYTYTTVTYKNPNNNSTVNKYYWIREGFGVKAVVGAYHDEASDVRLDLYKIPGQQASYDYIAMTGEHAAEITSHYTAVNNENLDNLVYRQYAAITNTDGTGTLTSYDYYVKRVAANGRESYDNVGGSKINNNFYYFKETEYNEKTGKYTFAGQDVDYDNVYKIGDKIGVFLTDSYTGAYTNPNLLSGTIANSGTGVYGGAVYGKNNEILLSGYDSKNDNWTTVWAGEITDPNATIESMTLSEFNEVLHHIHEEDVKLANAGIVSTKVTVGKDTQIITTLGGGTNVTMGSEIDLGLGAGKTKTITSAGSINMVNVAGKQVPGLYVVSSGGTKGNGDDTVITFIDSGAVTNVDANGNITTTQGDRSKLTLKTGSVVVANNGATYIEGQNNVLNTLTVNGKVYTVPTTAIGGTTSNNITIKSTGNNVNVTAETNSTGDTEYTIDAKDTTYTLVENAVNSNGVVKEYKLKNNDTGAFSDVIIKDTDTDTKYSIGTSSSSTPGTTNYIFKENNVDLALITDTNTTNSSVDLAYDLNTNSLKIDLIDSAGHKVSDIVSIPAGSGGNVVAYSDRYLVGEAVITGEGNEATTTYDGVYHVNSNGELRLNVKNGDQVDQVVIHDLVNKTSFEDLKSKVDGGWIAQVNGQAVKHVAPNDVLNFKNGNNVEIAMDVEHNIVINAIDTNTITDIVAGSNVSLDNANPTVDPQTGRKTYTINADNNYVNAGNFDYESNGSGKLVLTRKDLSEVVEIAGLKNTFVNDVTLNGNVLTFNYNDSSNPETVDLSGLVSSLGTMNKWQAKVGSASFEVSNNESVEYEAGKNVNLVLDAQNQKITVATKNEVVFDRVAVGGANGLPQVVIDNAGIDMNNQKLTGLADGINNDDAVNLKQLKESRTQVIQGENVEVIQGTHETGGHRTYTINAKDTKYTVSTKTQGVASGVKAEYTIKENGTNPIATIVDTDTDTNTKTELVAGGDIRLTRSETSDTITYTVTANDTTLKDDTAVYNSTDKSFTITDSSNHTTKLVDVARASDLQTVATKVQNNVTNIENILDGDLVKMGVDSTNNQRTIALFTNGSRSSGVEVSSAVGKGGQDSTITFTSGGSSFSVAAGSTVIVEPKNTTDESDEMHSIIVNGNRYYVEDTTLDTVTSHNLATDIKLGDVVIGKNYVVTDTAGNKVFIKDVASASALEDVIEQVTGSSNSITNVVNNILDGKLQNGDLFKISASADGKINLINTNTKNKTSIEVKESGGARGANREIVFSSDDGTFRVTTGSIVSATTVNGVVTGLSINGDDYNLVHTDNIAYVNNLAVNGGSGKAEYKNNEAMPNERHGWQIKDTAQTNVTFKDTTLDRGDAVATSTASDYGYKYTIYDTAGNGVVLNDVARASKLKTVAEQVSANTTNISNLTSEVNTNTSNITDIMDGKVVKLNVVGTNKQSKIALVTDNEVTSEINVSSAVGKGGNDATLKFKGEGSNEFVVDVGSTVRVQHDQGSDVAKGIIVNDVKYTIVDTQLKNDNATRTTNDNIAYKYQITDSSGHYTYIDDVASGTALKNVIEDVQDNADSITNIIGGSLMKIGVDTTNDNKRIALYANGGVKSDVDVSSSVGSGGKDATLTFSSEEGQFSVNVGSTVVVDAKDTRNNKKVMHGITVNGDYFVVEDTQLDVTKSGITSVKKDSADQVYGKDYTIFDTSGNTVEIEDIASAAYVNSSVQNINSKINNLTNELEAEAAKKVIVKNNDSNIKVVSSVDATTGDVTHELSLAANVKVAQSITVGDNIVLNSDYGRIKANTLTASKSVKVGDVLVTPEEITGLNNTEWDPSLTYNKGRAATEEQLLAAVNEVKNSAASDYESIRSDDIEKIVVSSAAGTVGLIRKSGVEVDGALKFTSGGGYYNPAGGTNKYPDTFITISNASGSITLNTGSKVTANVGHSTGEIKQLTTLEVNGQVYTIPAWDIDQYGNPIFQDYHLHNGSEYLGIKNGEDVDGYKVDDTGIVEMKVLDKHDESKAYSVVSIGNIASKSSLDELSSKVNNIETNVNNIQADINVIKGDIAAEYIKDGVAKGDGTITLNKYGGGTATITGLENHALVEHTSKDQAFKVDKDGVVELVTVDRYDSNYKHSTYIADVASATVVGATSQDDLQEKYKDTNYLATVETEAGEKGATESLVEADVKLDAAIKANAERDYNNDVILQEQIQNQSQYLDSRINQLGSKVNKVGAGAAALAALHPMDFDPDDKLSFAVGAGNYAGENATALGAFYRPNEKVMMNVAGTYGNGENMVNMGVSFALDRTNNVSNSRTAMAKEIVDLREQVATQGQQIAQLVALVQQLAGAQQPVVPAEQLFPDVPENHWAYEYVNGLIAKGIIEGYPDGTFGGDRAMTRYEFAAMLFRAMEQGVVINEQVRQEFEKELGRIRVDRVKGTDADLNKIERVRVNTAIDRDDYGSKVVQVKH